MIVELCIKVYYFCIFFNFFNILPFCHYCFERLFNIVILHKVKYIIFFIIVQMDFLGSYLQSHCGKCHFLMSILRHEHILCRVSDVELEDLSPRKWKCQISLKCHFAKEACRKWTSAWTFGSALLSQYGVWRSMVTIFLESWMHSNTPL